MNRVVCGRIDGESEGVEAIVFERDREILSGVPFSMLAELVFHHKRGLIPNAERVQGKHHGEGYCPCYLPKPLIREG